MYAKVWEGEDGALETEGAKMENGEAATRPGTRPPDPISPQHNPSSCALAKFQPFGLVSLFSLGLLLALAHPLSTYDILLRTLYALRKGREKGVRRK